MICKAIACQRRSKTKKLTMDNISHKKKWNTGTLQVHVEPPVIPLINSKNDDKSYKDFVKIKLRRDPTSEKLDLYEFKMALFDKGERGGFLLFICNFNMTIEASGTLNSIANIQYLHTPLLG